MEKLMYMMMIEKSKSYQKMTKQAVMEHVENIRKLDDEGKLEKQKKFANQNRWLWEDMQPTN